MNIIFAGTGSAFCMKNYQSNILIHKNGKYLLFDAGGDVRFALRDVGLSYKDISALYISHLHADHFFDLIPFRYALRRPIYRRLRPALYLPPGGKRALRKAVSAFDKSLDFFSGHFHIQEYDPREGIEVGTLNIEFAFVKHYIPSYAMAISGKKRLVYSADSGICDELAEIAKGADLFLCEAARCSREDGEWGHLLASDAVKLAKNAKVKKLILTHFWPDHDYSKELDKARQVFGKGLEENGILRTYTV